MQQAKGTNFRNKLMGTQGFWLVETKDYAERDAFWAASETAAMARLLNSEERMDRWDGKKNNANGRALMMVREEIRMSDERGTNKRKMDGGEGTSSSAMW